MWSGRNRSTCSVVLAVTMVFLAACSNDSDDGPLLNMSERTEPACLLFEEAPTLEIESLPEVPCAEPHSHEIYAALDYVVVSNLESATTITDVYPGFEALESFARAQCLSEFEDYVGISVFDSALFYSWILPTLNSWESDDRDREVLCVAGNGNGALLPPGTVEGSRR